MRSKNVVDDMSNSDPARRTKRLAAALGQTYALEKQIDPGNPDAVNARYQAALPSGRYSTVEEIANMVLFLCSDLAANTTGGQFVVDGGRTATGGAVTNQVTRP